MSIVIQLPENGQGAFLLLLVSQCINKWRCLCKKTNPTIRCYRCRGKIIIICLIAELQQLLRSRRSRRRRTRRLPVDMAVIYYVWRAQERTALNWMNDVMRINLGIILTQADKSGLSLIIYIARKSKSHDSHHQVLQEERRKKRKHKPPPHPQHKRTGTSCSNIISV